MDLKNGILGRILDTKPDSGSVEGRVAVSCDKGGAHSAMMFGM